MTQYAVFFDLDGTLADTALDLGGALNTLLRRHDLPEQAMSAIRPIASHGVRGLLKLGAGLTPEHPDFPVWRANYLAEYERCCDQKTVLFDGINRVLSALAAQNILWGIITNKPKTFTDRLVPKLNFAVPPAAVVSGDTCAEAKPSVLPMHHACQLANVQPECCLYVGDAERDIQAGRNAGMKTVLAQWGYIGQNDQPDTWQADFQAATPDALLPIVADWINCREA